MESNQRKELEWRMFKAKNCDGEYTKKRTGIGNTQRKELE